MRWRGIWRTPSCMSLMTCPWHGCRCAAYAMHGLVHSRSCCSSAKTALLCILYSAAIAACMSISSCSLCQQLRSSWHSRCCQSMRMQCMAACTCKEAAPLPHSPLVVRLHQRCHVLAYQQLPQLLLSLLPHHCCPKALSVCSKHAAGVQYQLNQRLVAAARAQLPLYGPSEDFSYDAR